VELKLKAETREESGKGPARRSRERGDVPAVMYGIGSEAKPLTIKREDVMEVLHSSAGSNALINLVVDGKTKDSHLVMIKEIQRDPIKDRLLHLDLLKVARDEAVTTRITIEVTGEEESVGLKAGGTLQHNLWDVEVECLPADLPDHLKVDITDVKIGEHLTVGDLEPRSGVTILTESHDIILTILAPRVVTVAEAEAEAAEAEAAAAAVEEGAEEAETGGEED
jgi:large subunit ribosomal protein L25